jgi:hypothetical protein
VFSTADVQVIRLTISTGLETTLTIVTDYTITLNGDQDSNPGGNIVLVAALSALYKLTATSDIANLQPTDLTNQGGFYPEVITDALDRATIQIQQISDIGDRTLKIPISDGALNMELPTAASRANSFLAFGATGLPTVVTAGSSGAPTTMTRQNFSGTGSQVAFTLASDPGALGNSAEVFIGGVYQNRTTYTISGLTLTFSAAPVLGTNNIEFVNFLTDAIGSTSADLVTYTPAGTGAVARTVDAKLKDTVHVKDFGAVCDGVTNDTAALNAAILFCQYNHKILHISGIVRIFSTINITEQLHIEFDCHQDMGSTIPHFSNGSFILKDPSVNGWGIVITAYGFSANGGGVRGVAGSDLGGGIWIKGQHTKWKKPSVYDVGGIGIKIGADANPPYNPSNCCLLESPIISENGSHGLYIKSFTNDANQCTITNAQIIGNGGCGIKCEGGRNIFIGADVEHNDSYGIYLTGTATGNTFLNGDIETNDNPGTLIDIKIDDSSIYNCFFGISYTNTSNFSYTSLSKTMIIDGVYGGIVTPTLKSERIIPSGAVGPEKVIGSTFGTPTIFPVGSVNAQLNIAPATTSTVFTMPSTALFSSSALVTASNGNNNRSVVAIVVATEGTATAVATNLYRTNADFDIVISGLNVQVSNTSALTVTAKTTAILF